MIGEPGARFRATEPSALQSPVFSVFSWTAPGARHRLAGSQDRTFDFYEFFQLDLYRRIFGAFPNIETQARRAANTKLDA